MKVIFHIDVNSAFLSWEAVYRLTHKGGTVDLRQIPSAIGGDITMRHGIILAKSIPAKKYGIKTGETIPEAKKKCPNLVLVPPNYSLYERCSKALMKLLYEYSDSVEQYSIDEAFVDMTGSIRLFGEPEQAAFEIKERIHNELGFTVNIGIGENKLLAKMASDFEKPNRVHTLWHWEIEDKMWSLPVEDLFFVGRATTGKLKKLGVQSIGDLARMNPDFLKGLLKKQGEVIWSFANGIDCSEVLAVPEANKGYGNSTTTPFDVEDMETAKRVLLALSETIGNRLRAEHVKIGLVSVGIRNADLMYSSHQKVLSEDTDITVEIYEAACELFEELWMGQPLRHLSIRTSRVTTDALNRQITLFEGRDYEKLSRLDGAVDDVRNRYGIDAIKRASFVSQAIDHMSGGVSREKRDVDYSKLVIE